MLYLALAVCIGIIAGLRAFTPLAIISWEARLGNLPLGSTWLAFLGYAWTPWILTAAAVGELINDKLPKTPSRTVPPQFAARILSGALSGAAVGAPSGSIIGGLVAGVIGAVIGTLGGAKARGALVRAVGGRDLPIALLEDATAILLGILIVSQACSNASLNSLLMPRP